MSSKQGQGKLRRWARRCCCLAAKQEEARMNPVSVPNVPEVLRALEELSNTPAPQAANPDEISLPSDDGRTAFTPSEEESEPHPVAHDELGLWGKALDHLDALKHDSDAASNAVELVEKMTEDSDREFESVQSSSKEIERMIKQAMTDKKADRMQDEWGLTIKGQEHPVCEFVDKAADILNKFAVLGDIAASVEPLNADLPWASVRHVLKAVTSDSTLSSETAFGLAKVTTLMIQCDLYQGLYNSVNLPPENHQEALSQLHESIVGCYVQSLLFLGFAYPQSSGVAAPFDHHDAEGYIQDLLDAEIKLTKSVEGLEKRSDHSNQPNVVELLRLLRESYQTAQRQEPILVSCSQSTAMSSLKTSQGAAFDSYTKQNDMGCSPDTRVELLGQAWAHDPDGRHIFWLQGMAVTGNPTISRAMAERFSATGDLVASFFFKRGEGDRGSAEHCITAICRLFSQRHHPFAQNIQNAIWNDPGINEAFSNERIEKLIIKPLAEMTSNLKKRPRIVVILDALDGCNQKSDIKRIVSFLSETNKQTGVDLNFFLTSRPELHMQISFKDIGDESHQREMLHDVPQEVVQKDISTYLTHESERIRENEKRGGEGGSMHTSEDWPTQQSAEALVKMAVPSFIFAATMCRLLADSTCCDPESELQRIFAHPMPIHDEKPNTTYLRALEHLLIRTTGSQKINITKGFRDIVGSIAVLGEPLSKLSLGQLLGIDQGTIGAALKPWSSVVSVPRNSTTPIQAFPLSFRESFIDHRGCTMKELWIDKRKTHEELATKCLNLLSDCLEFNICGLDSPAKRRNEIDQQAIGKALPPEVQYACRYWVYHLKEGQVKLDDEHQACQFLQKHFLHWIEALSLIGRISESIDFIRELQGLFDTESSAGLLLDDASRLIQQFHQAIDDAPLQLYSSVLYIAMGQRVIGNLFQRHIDRITQKQIIEQNWNACFQTIKTHDPTVQLISFSEDGKLKIGDSVAGSLH